jgi:hypothetical protein
MKDILPSMPKGEIVGNMATAKLTQMIKVVIDGNHKLKHRCCNTNAATQML